MLGRKAFNTLSIANLAREFERKGVKKLLTGCPNCHMTLKGANLPLNITSVYEELLQMGAPLNKPWHNHVTIHDPCVIRFEKKTQDSIRALLHRAGVKISEMKHSRSNTFCCGEGGAVGLIKKELAGTWTLKRQNEINQLSLPVVTYCAGCAAFLTGKNPAIHILDFLFSGRVKTPNLPGFPINYLNRIKLRFTARLK